MLKGISISLRSIGFVLFLLLMSSAARAQNATVSGVVSDSSGAVVANAQATLMNVATQAKLVTTSNKDGVYTLAGVGPGTY